MVATHVCLHEASVQAVHIILQCSALSGAKLLCSVSSYSALPFHKCGLPVSWPQCYWSKLPATLTFDAVDVSEHEWHRVTNRKFFRCFSSWYISAQVVKKNFRCLVVFVVPSFVVVHCCGDDGGVSVRPSDHHLFFLCLITFSVSVYCHCRHMTILCIHLICKLCRRACRYHVSGRPIVLSSKEKKITLGFIKDTCSCFALFIQAVSSSVNR